MQQRCIQSAHDVTATGSALGTTIPGNSIHFGSRQHIIHTSNPIDEVSQESWDFPTGIPFVLVHVPVLLLY